ncbi:MAG: hypothetical protein KF686_03550 [Ramlibacter sp.]|nr:hypothetical protein [Ramlibacter sp.]
MLARTLTIVLLPSIAWADKYGISEAMSESPSGPISGWSLLGMAAYFGAIYWFMTRFEDEQKGFLCLVGGVLLFLLIAGIHKCAG